MQNKNIWFLLLVSLVLLVAVIGCANQDTAIDTVAMQSSATPFAVILTEVLPTVEPDLMNEDQSHDIQTDPLNTFEKQFEDIILTRDFGRMSAIMPESFGFGLWRSEGYSKAKDQALEDLQANYFTDDFEVTFATPPDLSADLPDGDALNIWDPAANPVSALFTTGWGVEGKGEAFLIVAEPEDLTFHWVGMIYAPEGFVLTETP